MEPKDLVGKEFIVIAADESCLLLAEAGANYTGIDDAKVYKASVAFDGGMALNHLSIKELKEK